MNRPIEFRAWDETNRVMHYDFQFFTSGDGGNDWICFSSDKEQRDTTSHPHWIVFKNPYFRQQFHIMQFTGLLDKNGKKIFEGDIVEFPDGSQWKVYFAQGVAQFRYETLDESGFKDMSDGDNCEIIGNVFENPELLPHD